ncbi:hypothetical protein niasHS_008251 [Heterodera schachtii]|uniref:Tautomerase cis-CaaD-like domain-containing protein n=1 Tax=Heterodera schachtii TaxID=97005 RepID=A0ABD2IXA2_HETSC
MEVSLFSWDANLSMDLREAGALYKFDVDQCIVKPIIPRTHVHYKICGILDEDNRTLRNTLQFGHPPILFERTNGEESVFVISLRARALLAGQDPHELRENVREYFSEHCDTISEVHECDLFFVQLNGGEGWFAEDDQIQWDFAILKFDDHVKKRQEFNRIIRWVNSALKAIEENRVPVSPKGFGRRI